MISYPSFLYAYIKISTRGLEYKNFSFEKNSRLTRKRELYPVVDSTLKHMLSTTGYSSRLRVNPQSTFFPVRCCNEHYRLNLRSVFFHIYTLGRQKNRRQKQRIGKRFKLILQWIIVLTRYHGSTSFLSFTDSWEADRRKAGNSDRFPLT